MSPSRTAPKKAASARPSPRARTARRGVANASSVTPAEASLAALRDEVATLARAVAAQTRLLPSLEAVRAAVEPLESAARSLAEVAETLAATHHGWAESLLRLPRAEDYEPLAEPLREFARVSPMVAETLGSVVKAVTPLPAMVQQVLAAAGRLPAVRDGGGGQALRAPLLEAAESMASARTAIREGLSSLPRDRAYAEAAAHLRELATVSPSLMEWLRHLPAMSVPLGDAVESLDRAARDLEESEKVARRALDGDG